MSTPTHGHEVEFSAGDRSTSLPRRLETGTSVSWERGERGEREERKRERERAGCSETLFSNVAPVF